MLASCFITSNLNGVPNPTYSTSVFVRSSSPRSRTTTFTSGEAGEYFPGLNSSAASRLILISSNNGTLLVASGALKFGLSRRVRYCESDLNVDALPERVRLRIPEGVMQAKPRKDPTHLVRARTPRIWLKSCGVPGCG